MNTKENYIKRLSSALKLNGIIVRREFVTLIVESLVNTIIQTSDKYDHFNHFIKIICDNLENHIDVEKSIEREDIERTIEACMQLGIDSHETKFTVIDAFSFPKLYYDISRKQYFLDSKKSKIISGADKKNELFIHRYRNVLQRTKRNIKHKNQFIDENITISTIDTLLTVSQKTLDQNLILGSLFQGSNGKYFIEDPTGMIEMDLKHASYHGGFFQENCFVLVNGTYSDKVIQVSQMILPPGEVYHDSKSMFPNLNYFGGKSECLLRESEQLNRVMIENKDNMIVFISDLWLDKPIIFEKLEKLFKELSDSDLAPIAFVFMGNFLSQCFSVETFDTLSKSFKKLADIIYQYDAILRYSQFVFVPGLHDPPMRHILPRVPLPTSLVQEFQKKVPKSYFTTNPCRIQYCTREIVIYRNDTVSKLMHDALNKPSAEKIDDYVTKTIISQAHLSPFSLNVQPIHWNFDYTLHLYPLPDLIVMGDSANAYFGKYKGCSVINPGSFTKNGFSFKTYIPDSDTVQDCSL